MYDWELTLDLTNTVWQSDWNGDEVGYPEVEVVGLYMQERDDAVYYFYIDVENNRLLEFWVDPDSLEEN